VKRDRAPWASTIRGEHQAEADAAGGAGAAEISAEERVTRAA
jgi:hypothetical protein